MTSQDALRDRIDRELVTLDQKIARHTAAIDTATAALADLQATRRAHLAAVAALRGDTP